MFKQLDWSLEEHVDELREIYPALVAAPPTIVERLIGIANGGSTVACLYIAEYFMSLGNQSAEAQVWYEKAFSRGSAEAAYMFGRLRSAAQDYENAFTAFKAGAEVDYLPCVYRLAEAYRTGQGAPQDSEMYKALLEKAAAEGHIFSKRDLARLLLSGKYGVAERLRGLSLLSDTLRLALRKAGSKLDEKILA